MKKLIFLFAILFASCTKIEPNYYLEITYANNTTEVVAMPLKPCIVELKVGNVRDTIFIAKLPRKRVFAGNEEVTSRELNNVI